MMTKAGKRKIHVATIEYRNEVSFFAALDAETLNADVASYCREFWWCEDCPAGDEILEPPTDNATCIRAFFEVNGSSELATGTAELDMPSDS